MENKEFVINCIDTVTGRCEGVLNDEGDLKQFGDGGTVFTEMDNYELAEKKFLATAAFPNDWRFEKEEL